MAVFHTIEDFINSNTGSKAITYHNFSILNKKEIDGETFHFVDSNILDDYIDELNKLTVSISLSDRELLKYSYNPGLLAYDIYGSSELEFVILKLNGIIDPKDFDFPTIKLIEVGAMMEVLSNIYNAEYKYIEMNREENEIESA
jgi:hypothetical protein